jgi:hypothetical protein
MFRTTALVALLALVSSTREASAQRRAPGQPSTETSEVSVHARLGTKSYTSNIAGTCKHEPSASIYDLPAALYLVEAAGGDGSEIKQLNFTLWRPKNGSADQVSLSLSAGSSSTSIDVNPRSAPIGAASVELKPLGSGGTFEVKGKDSKGSPLNLTISCPVFAAVEAAGG